MAGGTFPTSAPTYVATAGSDTANATAGGAGLSGLLNQFETDVTALAAKMGTGASTPTSGKVLRANGTGTSVWGQLVMASDVAAFSSADIRGVVSDETGTGVLVFNSSPTIVTPTIADLTNMQHTHANAAGGGQISTSGIASGSITNALLSTSASEIGAAWTAWTPTVTAATGSFTTATGAGRYTQIGKTIHYQGSMTITTIGTGTGCVFTLPITAQASSSVEIGTAREDATAGSMGIVRLISSTTGSVARYDNGNILNGSGSVVRVYGTYEAA